jgi:hypothetical protein
LANDSWLEALFTDLIGLPGIAEPTLSEVRRIRDRNLAQAEFWFTEKAIRC